MLAIDTCSMSKEGVEIVKLFAKNIYNCYSLRNGLNVFFYKKHLSLCLFIDFSL